MKKFTKELIRLTEVSREYAIATWYALSDSGRAEPTLAAAEVAGRYNLI